MTTTLTQAQIPIAQKLLTALQALLLSLTSKTVNAPVATGDPELYTLAKAALGTHITLDPTVPAEVGCAEATSYLLWKLGLSIPAKGIAGTAALEAWVIASGLFTKRTAPGAGFLIFSSTGTGNGSVEGHTGVMAKFNLQFPNDWGILSNNSNNGLYMEVWSLAAWVANYVTKGGLELNYYEYTGPAVA